MQNPKAGEIWYHFKYPQGCGDDRPYKIIGLSYDTTSEVAYVVYQPLYINELIENKKADGIEYFIRPLSEWFDPKEVLDGKDGNLHQKQVPRFQRAIVAHHSRK